MAEGITTLKIRRSKTDKSPVTVNYDFGGTVEDSISKFDGSSILEKVVHGLFVTAAKAQLQDFVRSLIVPRVSKSRAKTVKGKAKASATPEAALTAEQIQARVDAWKPAIERRSKSKVARVGKMLDKLSPEEKAALRLQLGD